LLISIRSVIPEIIICIVLIVCSLFSTLFPLLNNPVPHRDDTKISGAVYPLFFHGCSMTSVWFVKYQYMMAFGARGVCVRLVVIRSSMKRRVSVCFVEGTDVA